MKMTREERELRRYLRGYPLKNEYPKEWDDVWKETVRLILAMRRAIIEECARVVESCGNDEYFERIADSIRKGNNEPFKELFGN